MTDDRAPGCSGPGNFEAQEAIRVGPDGLWSRTTMVSAGVPPRLSWVVLALGAESLVPA